MPYKLITTLLMMTNLSLSTMTFAEVTQVNEGESEFRTITPSDSAIAKERESLKYDEDFTTMDFSLAVASTFGAVAPVGLLGATLYIVGAEKIASPLPVLVLLAMPLGPYVYGKTQGFEGSYWSGLAGLGIALVSGGTLAFLAAISTGAESSLTKLSSVIASAGVILGPTIGYKMSLVKDPSRTQRASSLLSYSPSYGVSAGLPLPQISYRHDGQQISFNLFGGTF